MAEAPANTNDFEWVENPTAPGGPEEPTEGDRGGVIMSRRNVGRAAAALLIGSGGAAATSYFASQPALAASGHEDWIANGANIEAHDGSVDQLTFGETGENDDLHLSWEGLNSDDRAVNFRILVKGTNDGDTDGWDGGNETAYEELASAEPGVTLGSTNGSDEHSWTDVFGEAEPVDVDQHTEIDVTADFSAGDDGQTRERELAVDLEVWIDGEDGSNGPAGDALGDRKQATATISVTNKEATIAIGGQGSFVLSSSEAV